LDSERCLVYIENLRLQFFATRDFVAIEAVVVRNFLNKSFALSTLESLVVTVAGEKMNTEGCPNLWAKDEILTFGNGFNSTDIPCNLLVPAWLLFGILSCLFGGWVAFSHWKDWIRRERRKRKDVRQQSTGRKNQQQRPVVPVLSTFSLVFQILFIALASTNVISSRDGSSALAWSLMLCWNMFIAESFALKLVKLGNRISKLKDTNAEFLKDLDRFQQFLLVMSGVFFTANMISPFFVFLYSSPPAIEAFRVQWISYEALAITGILLICRQFGRVLDYISTISNNNELRLQADSPTSTNIKEAVGRLVKQRRMLLAWSLLAFTINVYVSVTLNCQWWLILVYFVLDLSTLLMMNQSLQNKNGAQSLQKKNGAAVRNSDKSMQSKNATETMNPAAIKSTSHYDGL